ncbi:hypothetical protein DPMN_031736 [Dreissena polymorpha]|uniref:Uncharacterized protein n=1 Tax=Dreissena polymorpha TaxID=45954 RepID=A0A9D4M565_DREPO|nr:hypothetical protein DPMN_031736 [Dreissena polymorpha]
MADTTVVSDITESIDSMPNQIVSPERPVNSMQGSGQSSRTGGSGVDCVAVIDRSFSTKGFSKDTRALLAKYLRKGTQRDYTSNLDNSIAGVINNRLIHIQHL